MTIEELKKIARTEVDRLKGEIEKRDNLLTEKDKEITRLKKWNKWFFYRVKFMRQCQREYFRLRLLSKDKKLEERQRDYAAEDAIKQLKEHFGDLEEVELEKSLYMKGQEIQTNNYWDKKQNDKQ